MEFLLDKIITLDVQILLLVHVQLGRQVQLLHHHLVPDVAVFAVNQLVILSQQLTIGVDLVCDLIIGFRR